MGFWICSAACARRRRLATRRGPEDPKRFRPLPKEAPGAGAEAPPPSNGQPTRRSEPTARPRRASVATPAARRQGPWPEGHTAPGGAGHHNPRMSEPLPKQGIAWTADDADCRPEGRLPSRPTTDSLVPGRNPAERSGHRSTTETDASSSQAAEAAWSASPDESGRVVRGRREMFTSKIDR